MPTEAIVDLTVVALEDDPSSNPCPAGYSWIDSDLNVLAGGDYIYFCYLRGSSANALTDIKFISTEDNHGNICGAGWTFNGIDLNDDAGGNYIYLCHRKDGDYPIIDLDVVTGITNLVPCSYIDDSWARINQDLNEEAGGLYVYLCYRDVSTAGNLTNCGNEGESPCAVFTKFYWENGAGSCDRGLRESSGLCINGAEPFTRRNSDIESFQASWTYWALLNQRNQLAFDVPLGRVMHLGGHNSYNNHADGYIAPNQTYSITDQLRAGMRVVDLDVHAGPGVLTGTTPELCHGNSDHGGCTRTDRMFFNAIKEVRNWLRASGNQNEVIVILVEDYIDSDEREQMGDIIFAFQLFLDRPNGIGVFTNDDYLHFNQTVLGHTQASDYRLPSQAELLSGIATTDGQPARVIIATQKESYPPYSISQGELDLRGFGSLITQFEPYPVCEVADRPIDPEGDKFAQVFGNRVPLIGGDLAEITETDLKNLAKCNANLINVDGLLATTSDSTSADELKGAIWSWTADDRGNGGNAALMSGSTARWSSRNTTESHPYVCRLPDGSWGITSGTGAWLDGFDTCRREFGNGAEFSVPVNGNQNFRLDAVNTGNSDLWLNYNDILTEGNWLINSAPVISEVLAPATVNEGGIAIIRVTATDDGTVFQAPTPDCGPHGDLVPGSLSQLSQSTLANGDVTVQYEFQCRYPDGDMADGEVSFSVSDDIGVTTSVGDISIDVLNVDPSLVPGSPLTGNEGSEVSLLGATFSDPGYDCPGCLPPSSEDFTVSIDWGDGLQSSGTVNETSGGPGTLTTGSITASHTYGDNGSYVVTIEICDDDDGCTTKTLTAEIANVPPSIDAISVPAFILHGEPVLVEVEASDPAGINDPLTYKFDCDGDGVFETDTAGTPAVHCLPEQSELSPELGVQVSDDDLGVTTSVITLGVTKRYCANLYTGKLSEGIIACKAGTYPVLLQHTTTTTLCHSHSTAALSYFPPGCPGSWWTSLGVPSVAPIPICESFYTGTLRLPGGSNGCLSSERARFIPAR